MRISSIIHYFFGLSSNELEIIEKQKAKRHLLHKQINLSKIKLKPTKTIVKTGIYDLDKKSLISECIDISKVKYIDELEKKTKRTKKLRKR
jgi:hypothetical protein